MAPFASTIAHLCFQAFSSPVWTVQNAALQLFGVLVPLLVGEKKVQDDDVETYGNLTSEEFFSHHPSLMALFLEELKKYSTEEGTTKKIVPILSFLSKLTVGDSLSVHNCSTEMLDLRKYLNFLMRNCHLEVKKIAAKCFSRFVLKESLDLSVYKLLFELNTMDKCTNNECYSILVAMLHLVSRLVEEGADVETFKCIREDFQVKSMCDVSWVSCMTALELMQQLEKHSGNSFTRDYVSFIKFVLLCLERHSMKGMVPAGVYSWASQCIDFTLEMCGDKELCLIWTMLYTSDWDEHALVCLLRIRERVSSLSVSVKEELMNTLMSCVSNGWTKDWELLCSIYETLLVIKPYINLTTSSRIINTIFSNTKKEYSVQGWSVSLPLTCELFLSHIRNFDILPQKDVDFLKVLATETLHRTSPDDYVVELRVHGAKAFVALFRELVALHLQNTVVESNVRYVDVVSMVLDSGVAFLQDEDISVRREASRIVVPEQNPYAVLLSLLSVQCLCKILSPLQIARYFMNKLFDFTLYEKFLSRCESRSKCVVSTSPFDYAMSNVYAEEVHILRTVAENFLALVESSPPWLRALPTVPDEQTMRHLTTRLLEAWRTAENSTTKITPKMHTLLLRLRVLAHVSEKMFADSSPEDYSSLVTLMSSSLNIS